jgi:hypothetical protein
MTPQQVTNPDCWVKLGQPVQGRASILAITVNVLSAAQGVERLAGLMANAARPQPLQATAGYSGSSHRENTLEVRELAAGAPAFVSARAGGLRVL